MKNSCYQCVHSVLIEYKAWSQKKRALFCIADPPGPFDHKFPWNHITSGRTKLESYRRYPLMNNLAPCSRYKKTEDKKKIAKNAEIAKEAEAEKKEIAKEAEAEKKEKKAIEFAKKEKNRQAKEQKKQERLEKRREARRRKYQREYKRKKRIEAKTKLDKAEKALITDGTEEEVLYQANRLNMLDL